MPDASKDINAPARDDTPARVGAAHLETPGAPPDPRFSRQVLVQATTGIVIQDMDGRLEWMNPAAEAMFCVTCADVCGQKVLGRLLPDETRPSPKALDTFRYDVTSSIFERDHLARHRRADGSSFWNLQSFMLIDTEHGQKVAVFCRDVTEQVESQKNLSATKAQLEHAAFHDDLTGLANRKRLNAYLQSPSLKDAFKKRQLGILHLDVDKFKEINDTLGHAAGDATLVHVANALRSAAGPRDLACRLGGDEFLLICAGLSGTEPVYARAELMMRQLSEEFLWKGQTVRVGISVGASLVEDETQTPDDLIHQADQALYAAKAQGRGRVVFFTPELGKVQTTQNQLARDIRLAIAEDQLEVHLQPQLNLRTGRVYGFETLLRWNHPKHGQLSPASFLCTAQRAGVLADIDYHAMNLSLDALKTLHKAGFNDLRVSLNVSSDILSDANYPGLLDWALQSRGLKPAHVCVEILETTIMQRDKCSVSAAVERLQALGTRVALDDFGTGYAGLAHMSTLEVDAIKLDRSMTATLDTDTRSREIVSSIIELCRRLDINVVAEGVETPAQIQILKEVNCPAIQGYFLARPMPLTTMTHWLARNMPTPEAWTKMGTETKVSKFMPKRKKGKWL